MAHETLFHYLPSGITVPAIGATIDASWNACRLWEKKLQGLAGPLYQVTHPTHEQIARAIGNARIKGQVGTPMTRHDAVTWIRDTLMRADMLSEFVFEHVRLTEAAHLPSRMNSLYAFSGTLNPLTWARWAKVFRDHTLVSLRPSTECALHQADMRLLNDDGSNVPTLIENARKYWRGEETATYQSEILVRGSCEVVEVFSPAQRNARWQDAPE